MGESLVLAVAGNDAAAARAASVLACGRVAVLPTDTVYGLTAAVFRPADAEPRLDGREPALWREPIDELYRIKGRPGNQPALILARDWSAAAEITKDIPDGVETFCRAETTPVTAILDAKHPWGPPMVNEAGGIAVRVPAAGWIRRVLATIPYLFSVSANEPGGPEPLSVGAVPAAMIAAAALAVDGGAAPAPRSSSLVDFTVTPPKILRGDGELRTRLKRRFKE